MKLLAFSDIHIDAVTAGRPRKAEVVAFLNSVHNIAIEQDVDLVIFGGDAHDSGWLLDPMYSAELIFGLLRIPQPLVAIAGNHDVIDTSELFLDQPITTLTPVRAASMFAAPIISRGHTRRVTVMDKPRVVEAIPGWAVLGLPYVSRAFAAQNEAWLDEAFLAAKELQAAGKQIIVVGHLVVPDAAMGSESVEMAKGQEQMFPFHRVDWLKPAFILNGHYHARQIVKTSGMKIVIPGSPLRFTFGEAAEVSKGVCIVEL